MSAVDLNAAVAAWMVANEARVIEWRHHFHRNPELGHQEFETTAYIVEQLRAAGLEPRVFPAGTGLTVDLGPADGPMIALRADIDALPIHEESGVDFASENDGRMHACGHDTHIASLLGAVLALASIPELPGRIRAIFQPAEEVITGALVAIDVGVMEGVDRIFMLHATPMLPTGMIGAVDGTANYSSDVITVQVNSPGGHSSRPQSTGDIVYALGTLAKEMPSLLTRRLDPLWGGVMVWGRIEGGKIANVIPNSGVISGTLRLGSREAWDQAPALFAELVEQLLAPLQVTHSLDYARGVPPVVNEESSMVLARSAVERILGEGSFISLPQITAGEDFAYYLDHAPGAMINFGVWDGVSEQAGAHTANYRADDASLKYAVRSYAAFALEALDDLCS